MAFGLTATSPSILSEAGVTAWSAALVAHTNDPMSSELG